MVTYLKSRVTIKVDSIDAKHGTKFELSYVSKLKAINDLRDSLSVADQGKDTGMLILSITGMDRSLIQKY